MNSQIQYPVKPVPRRAGGGPLIRRFGGILLLLAGLLGRASLPAQDFTLEEAIALARANNTDLAKTRTALEQARRASKFSWNSLLPVISLGGGVGHSHQIYPSGAAASDPTWSITGEVRFSLKGDVPAQMKLAAVSLRTAEAAYLDAELTLISTVSTTFYQLLADKENLTILRDAMTLYQSQYEETKRKYDQGLASELDMLRAELTWRKSGPAVEEAELRYERDMAQFRLTIGAGGEGSPQGVIEERQLRLPGPEELADWHLGRRNDVRTAVLAAEAGKLTARQKSLSARSPTITLSESLPLSGAKSGFAGVDTLKGTFSLSVSIPVNPWLPFSSDGLNIQSAQEDAVTAEMALAYTRKQAALDIREKVDALRQAEEDIATAELSYRIANRVYELSQKSYNAGLESQTDMLNDRQDMVSARQAVLVAEIARIEAVYALAAALGMRVEELYGLYGGE